MRLGSVAVSVEGDRAQIPRLALDHPGFREWATSPECPEDLRVAFVDGEVLLERSPEEAETHNKLTVKVTAVLSQLAEDEGLGEVFADGVLLTHSGARLSTEPDLIFVSWEASRTGRVQLVKKADRPDRYVELEGTPDLVVEIVSDSSVRKDTVLLREGYARAGIPEYWLIDARMPSIKFEILHLANSEYRPAASAEAPQPSQVFGRRWTLTRSHNREGRFAYQLRGDK